MAATARVVKLTEDEEAEAFRALAEQSRPRLISDAYKIGPHRRWFAVYTHPRCEKKVVKALKRQEIVSYVPIARTWRKQSARQKHQREPKKEIERPVWPSYVFVALPVEILTIVAGDGTVREETIRAPFEVLHKTDGVAAIVSEGDKPFVIPRVAIAELRQREAAGDFNEMVKNGPIVAPKWCKPGVSVHIEAGPFCAFNGIVEEILPHEIAKVCVIMFGRVTPIEIEIDRIKPL